MKKISCLLLSCFCTLAISAQNLNGTSAAAMHKKDSILQSNKVKSAQANAQHKRDSIMASKKAGAPNPKQAAAMQQHKRDSIIASKKAGAPMPPKNPVQNPMGHPNSHPVHASSAVVSGGGNQKSAEGTNQIVYIDNHGIQSVGIATIPSGGGIAQWEQTNNQGVPNDGGHLYESFGYLGDNGKLYQTQIVAVPSSNPAKGYDVHFQNRLFGQGDYKEGHVIILDWRRIPG